MWELTPVNMILGTLEMETKHTSCLDYLYSYFFFCYLTILNFVKNIILYFLFGLLRFLNSVSSYQIVPVRQKGSDTHTHTHILVREGVKKKLRTGPLHFEPPPRTDKTVFLRTFEERKKKI